MSAPGKEAPGHWLKRSGGGEGGIFSRKGYVCVQGNSKRSYNYISNRSSHWQIEGEETKVWSTNLRRESIAIFNKWADCCTFGPFLGPNDSFRLLSHHILCTTTARIKNSDSLSLSDLWVLMYFYSCRFWWSFQKSWKHWQSDEEISETSPMSRMSSKPALLQ